MIKQRLEDLLGNQQMQSPTVKSTNANKSTIEENLKNDADSESRSTTVMVTKSKQAEVKPPVPAKRWQLEKGSRITISKVSVVRDSSVKPQIPPRSSKVQPQEQHDLSQVHQHQFNRTSEGNIQSSKFREVAKKISQSLNSSTTIFPNTEKIPNSHPKTNRRDNSPKRFSEPPDQLKQNLTDQQISSANGQLNIAKVKLDGHLSQLKEEENLHNATSDAETGSLPQRKKFLEVALKISQSLRNFGGNGRLPDRRPTTVTHLGDVQQNPLITVDVGANNSFSKTPENLSSTTEFCGGSVENLEASEEPTKFLRTNMNEILDFHESAHQEHERIEDDSVAEEYGSAKRIINEFIATEETYIAVLEKIIQQYRPYLNQVPNKAEYAGKLCILFGNVDDLCKELKKFLADLKKKPDAGGVATAFNHGGDMVEQYSIYARNRPSVDTYYKWFEEMSKHIEGDDFIDLASYLLTPVQRPIKYIRFLEKLEAVLNSNNEYSCHIASTIETIKGEIKKTNDLMASDSIEDVPAKLVPLGSFIMQENFEMVKPKKKKVVAILFTNVIIFSTITEHSEKFKYFGSILLSNLRVPPLTKNPEQIYFDDYHMMTSGSKSHSYTLQAKNLGIKQLWMEILANVLWEQFEHAKQELSSKRISWEKRKGYSETAVAYIKKLRPINSMMEAEVAKIAALKAKIKE